ncbi:MAG: hypothetical protein ACXV4B_03585 [Halobacteriota archaeon]
MANEVSAHAVFSSRKEGADGADEGFGDGTLFAQPLTDTVASNKTHISKIIAFLTVESIVLAGVVVLV